AGLEQRLVGVDVADAGNRGLIEQNRLQHPPAAAQDLEPVIGAEVPRFGAELFAHHCLDVRRAGTIPNAAEAARVAEAQFCSIVQSKHKMRVRLARLVRRHGALLPRHGEVSQLQRTAEVNADPLAEAAVALMAAAGLLE